MRVDEAEKDENKKKGKEPIPMVGFFSLFKYSTTWDKVLIIFATIIAIAAGFTMPVILTFFGFMIDLFINYEKSLLANYTNMSDYNKNIDKEAHIFLRETSKLSGYIALIGTCCLICNYLYVLLYSMAAGNQVFRIRCMFMASVLKQEIGWYDTNQTADFACRFTDDLVKIRDGIGDKVGICISFIASTLCCIGLGFYYGWKLALVILCVTPVLIIATGIMSKVQAAVSMEESEVYGTAGAIAEEVLSFMRTVVAFGGEKKEIERYERCLQPAVKKGIKRGLITSIGAALVWFCIFGGYALAFWYGVKLIIDGKDEEKPEYSGGTVVVVFLNVMMASMYIGQTAIYFEAFNIARGAAAKVYDVIEREPLIDISSNNGMKPSSVVGKITLRDIHFSYPSRPTVSILNGVSLEVEAGETIALVGPSGCGKSTVIQLILRFYDSASGSIEIDGNNVKDLNVGWLRDSMSLVGQEPVLFSTTVEENIKHGKPDATQEEVEKAANLANIHEFIDSLPLKYKTLVGERGTQLSGGQKQRIAIARAMIKNPKILLLDEATSALDTESEYVVQAALDEASVGRTTIIVAHRLSTIRNADKIIVLKDGIVQEIGTHDELMMRQEIYYDLVLTQTKEASEEEELGEFVEEIKDKHETSGVSSETHNSDDVPNGLDKRPSMIQSIYGCQGNTCRRGSSFASDSRQSRYVLERQMSLRSYKKTPLEKQVNDEDEKANLPVLRLLKLTLPEWPYTLIGGLSALIMGVHFPMYGVLFGAILGVLKEDYETIKEKYVLYCLLFFILAITSFVFNFLQLFMFTCAGEKLTYRLRTMVFANVITQDIPFFDDPKNSVGSLCFRLTSDASNVQGAAGTRLSTLLQALSTIVVCIIIGLYYNYKIGLVVMAFIPFALLSAVFEVFVIRGHMSDEKSATESASKVAVEAIESIRTVASLHQEKAFYNQFKNFLFLPHKKFQMKSHARGLMFGFAQAIQAFAIAVTFYYGSRLVERREIHYENVIKVMQGVFAGVMMVGQSFAFSPDFQKGKVAAARIFKLLDLKPKIDAFSTNGRLVESIEGYIQFRRVHFNYPSRPDIRILKGLNLDIEPGKTVALVGSSGCGKSTCIQLIQRFYDTSDGKVMLDNVNVAEMNVSNLRSHLGLVSQEPVLFSYSIGENIAYGDNTRKVDTSEIIEAAKQSNIHSFIASLPQGYETPVGDKGTQLSGGQKQRIAIARALLRNPKILLLDEATSALDAESEKVVQEALDRARSGRTCIVIAHRLSTIQNADVIMVIHNGRVVEMGTHQELLNIKGYYYNLQNVQS